MRLDDCTPDDTVILVSIVILSMQLSGEFPLYAQALGELRRQYFGIAGPKVARKDRASSISGRGSVGTRQIRASKRYGEQ